MKALSLRNGSKAYSAPDIITNACSQSTQSMSPYE
jgi:hypothetical protein